MEPLARSGQWCALHPCSRALRTCDKAVMLPDSHSCSSEGFAVVSVSLFALRSSLFAFRFSLFALLKGQRSLIALVALGRGRSGFGLAFPRSRQTPGWRRGKGPTNRFGWNRACDEPAPPGPEGTPARDKGCARTWT